jgi:predicted secreted hydrolase
MFIFAFPNDRKDVGRAACRSTPAAVWIQRWRFCPALSTKEFNTANNKEYDESQNFREGA